MTEDQNCIGMFWMSDHSSGVKSLQYICCRSAIAPVTYVVTPADRLLDRGEKKHGQKMVCSDHTKIKKNTISKAPQTPHTTT